MDFRYWRETVKEWICHTKSYILDTRVLLCDLEHVTSDANHPIFCILVSGWRWVVWLAKFSHHSWSSTLKFFTKTGPIFDFAPRLQVKPSGGSLYVLQNSKHAIQKPHLNMFEHLGRFSWSNIKNSLFFASVAIELGGKNARGAHSQQVGTRSLWILSVGRIKRLHRGITMPKECRGQTIAWALVPSVSRWTRITQWKKRMKLRVRVWVLARKMFFHFTPRLFPSFINTLESYNLVSYHSAHYFDVIT